MQIGGAGHECTEASFVDDEILPLYLKLRPQLEAMAAAAKGFIQRLAALGRRKVGKPSRPLGDCCVVYQVPDENVEAARRADRRADPVDVCHDLPRLANLDSGAWLHESVLEVDDDVRGPHRIEMIKHVSAAKAAQLFRYSLQAKLPAGVGLSRAAHGMHLIRSPCLSYRLLYPVPGIDPAAFERVMALEDRSVLS